MNIGKAFNVQCSMFICHLFDSLLLFLVGSTGFFASNSAAKAWCANAGAAAAKRKLAVKAIRESLNFISFPLSFHGSGLPSENVSHRNYLRDSRTRTSAPEDRSCSTEFSRSRASSRLWDRKL